MYSQPHSERPRFCCLTPQGPEVAAPDRPPSGLPTERQGDMGSEVVELGGLVGAAMLLRLLVEFIVVFWSLRADERGRRHALRVLALLRGRREPP